MYWIEVSPEDRFYCIEVSPEDRFYCIEVSPEDRFYYIEVSPEDRFYCIEVSLYIYLIHVLLYIYKPHLQLITSSSSCFGYHVSSWIISPHNTTGHWFRYSRTPQLFGEEFSGRFDSDDASSVDIWLILVEIRLWAVHGRWCYFTTSRPIV